MANTTETKPLKDWILGEKTLVLIENKYTKRIIQQHREIHLFHGLMLCPNCKTLKVGIKLETKLLDEKALWIEWIPIAFFKEAEGTLQERLIQALKTEDYETASKIRDIINSTKDSKQQNPT
jgi:hypothetical protein